MENNPDNIQDKPSQLAKSPETQINSEKLLIANAPAEVQTLIKKYQARARQLRMEIQTRKEENSQIASANLLQNEELRTLNMELDKKVKARTAALEKSKKQLEYQNHELQEINESKEAMMHMIVHDMKNPLTPIMGTLILMQKVKGEISEDMKDCIKDAHIQSIKLRTMMDDILTISKMKSHEFKAEKTEVDLISILQQSVLLMCAVKGKKDIKIEFVSRIPELLILIDFQMAERVINNIINNAIKYAPPGSKIILDTTIMDKNVIVSISDFGKGIPPDFHDKIFDMFTRVSPQDKKISGTGLGLAFCKLAIEAHNGRIWVDSPVKGHDCGTTFSFSLPLDVPGEKE